METGLSAARAQRIVLDAARPLAPQLVLLDRAEGCVLADDVISSRTLPPNDVSAMDGYAVRSSDLRGATGEQPVVLRIAFEVPAGAAARTPLPEGAAARIFTGAALPPGADTVVRQEDTEREGDRVRVRVETARRTDVRDAGEDVRAGDLVLARGARLGPAEIGMLASLGRTVIPVHRRPRVAIVSGGDELIQPDGDPAGGRIVGSNAWGLAAASRASGADALDTGIAKDTPEALAERLRAALVADVIVSSAGVSVGDRDYVRPVLESLGCTIVFWGVKIRPGYPLVFGRFGERGPLVFALPGNPVSALVTFEEFVRPALLQMAGRRRMFRPTVRARMAEALTKPAGRLHFVRVRLERDGDGFVASSTGNQSSGVLRSMTLADGLLVFPSEATTIAAGDTATVQVLDDDVLAAGDGGLGAA